MDKKIRASVSAKNDNVATHRQDLIKEAIQRYDEAVQAGYYLEAIAICESLITDRMESRIGELNPGDVKLDTFGRAHQLLKSIEKDSDLNLAYNEAKVWIKKRNKAIHQSVKLTKGDLHTWKDFTDTCRKTAEEGLDHFRKIDDRLKSIRRKKQKALPNP